MILGVPVTRRALLSTVAVPKGAGSDMPRMAGGGTPSLIAVSPRVVMSLSSGVENWPAWVGEMHADGRLVVAFSVVRSCRTTRFAC